MSTTRRGAGRRNRWRLSGAAALLVATAVSVPSAAIEPGTPSPVIVQASTTAQARLLVSNVIALNGVGTVGIDLPLVNGVAALLTADEITQLSLSAVANVVTPDAEVLTAMRSSKGGPPAPTPQLVNVFTAVTGADTVIASGNNGRGVAVAVVDTGIAPLSDFRGRLLNGVDLSGEGNAQLDSFGHGTFIAGLVAGSGSSSRGKYRGEAPGASLVPVKVAGASGKTNVSTLISGLQWIKDNRGTIKVINLSVGALPLGPTAVNPLNQAVEQMWLAGFTVVASAGNNGSDDGTITSPGDDPLVITVGALDDKHTISTSDDVVAAYSSRGPTRSDGWWKPDLLAPGSSLVSVVPTTSVIWRDNATARIGKTNFVGSGTSFAAAVTSGAAALLYVDNPAATPDNIKAALLTTTRAGPAPPQSPFAQGHGVLDVAGAVAQPLVTMNQDLARLPSHVLGQQIPLLTTQVVSTWASGGTLAELAAYPGGYPYPYSGAAVSSLDPLTGTPLFQSSSWNSSSWNSSSWNSSSWNSSSWNSSSWNSSSWNSSSWNSSSWQ